MLKLVTRDRDTPKDDDEGDNGARSISLHSSLETSKPSPPKLHHINAIVLRLQGSKVLKENPTKSGLPEDLHAQRVSFIIPSSKCLIMPETSS